MPVEMVSYKYGRLLALVNDVYMGRFLRDYGEYSDGEVTEIFARMLRPGDLVIQAGASIGVHTVPMARLVSPGGHVFAFEPQRMIYNLLCGNIALNCLTEVTTPFHAAAGAEPGYLKLPAIDYDSAANFGGVSLSKEGNGDAVRVLPLDHISARLRGRTLRLIMADVEGMEESVLQGAVDIIHAHRPFLYLEDDRPENSASLRSFVRELGYRAYHHRPHYVPAERAAPDIRHMGSYNLLCVPQELGTTVLSMEEAL